MSGFSAHGGHCRSATYGMRQPFPPACCPLSATRWHCHGFATGTNPRTCYDRL